MSARQRGGDDAVGAARRRDRGGLGLRHRAGAHLSAALASSWSGRATPPATIGLSAAMTPLGFICCAPLVPPLARRFGAGARSCCAAPARGAAPRADRLDAATSSPGSRCASCSASPCCPLYIVSEVWIIALAPPERRGRILGIYTSVISGRLRRSARSRLIAGRHGGLAAVPGRRRRLPRPARSVSLAVLPRLPDHRRRAASAPRSAASCRSRRCCSSPSSSTAVLEQASLSLLPVYGLAPRHRRARRCRRCSAC